MTHDVSDLPPDARPAAAPPLARDRSFWGLTVTQFLGAFNDNAYKQLVLLLCASYATVNNTADGYSSVAQAVFAAPFILFSGLFGLVADRVRKTTIFVSAKVLEIGVMVAAVAVFLTFDTVMPTPEQVAVVRAEDPAFEPYPIATPELLTACIVVVALMSFQSTLFGPAKYGVLPELFREEDLPRVNGVVQMTTFVAIIFGTVLTGLLVENFGDRLWLSPAVAIGIAVVGTLTALVIRRTPVAAPDAELTRSTFVGDAAAWRLIRSDGTLRSALICYVAFWMLGAVLQPTINRIGLSQLNRGAGDTSFLYAAVAIGIAAGCALAGRLSRSGNRPELAGVGAVGVFVCGTLGAVAPFVVPGVAFSAVLLCLAGLGVSAGMVAVPLQVILQTRPPAEMKGRMIGTQNLCTWLGILVGSAAYFGLSSSFGPDRISLALGVVGASLLPVAWVYLRPGSRTAGVTDA